MLLSINHLLIVLVKI